MNRVPPPSGALRDAVASMQPVAQRHPVRRWLAAVAASLAVAAAAVAALGTRRDLGELPGAWLAAFSMLWLLGIEALLGAAIIPRPGSVLPNARRAGAAGLVFGALAAGLLAAFAIAAPSSTIAPAGAANVVRYALPCIATGLGAAALPAALALWLTRTTAPVHPGWLAAGVGSAAGAVGSLVLHLHCPIANANHLALAHGGVPLLAAALAALAVRFRTRS